MLKNWFVELETKLFYILQSRYHKRAGGSGDFWSMTKYNERRHNLLSRGWRASDYENLRSF